MLVKGSQFKLGHHFSHCRRGGGLAVWDCDCEPPRGGGRCQAGTRTCAVARLHGCTVAPRCDTLLISQLCLFSASEQEDSAAHPVAEPSLTVSMSFVTAPRWIINGSYAGVSPWGGGSIVCSSGIPFRSRYRVLLIFRMGQLQ